MDVSKTNISNCCCKYLINIKVFLMPKINNYTCNILNIISMLCENPHLKELGYYNE